MKKAIAKEYVVFGLGRFGSSVARQLEQNGCHVLAVDRNPELVEKVADDVTHAIVADVSDIDSLEELGLGNFDGAIIAMASELEASVLATIWAKEQGVPFVMVKAYNDLQARILKKVGADAIVYPETEMGIHIANNLAYGQFFDTIEITNEYSIVDLPLPEDWVGRSLIELNLRKKYNLNVIGLKRNGKLNMVVSAEAPLAEDVVLVVVGRNDALKKLKEKQEKK